ncbi:alpha/beta hydrolase [Novosphingobium sp. Rr 2-17]|uniref:alpha/beta hydrolase n=1 Tax=Novosphingobium sp. Rr 2-17 TaxID=555793 RepID=UPI0002698E6E|nr:alpha/beta hydrolase [Novosphingobium sp. Rr 2-17]EIZ80938.1 alpha/beta hydrolase [Novosphingobium sp. Rr 2-17]
MRSSIAILLLGTLFAASPLSAQEIQYESVEVGVDHFVFGGERSLSFDIAYIQTPATPSAPLVLPARGRGDYGPFRVIDDTHAALIDVTDAASPRQFAAMLRVHPGIAVIEMIECPGTEDDLANLRLGRMIRAHGIVTHVPQGGSVRSGGVELFLAGARRYVDPGAEFAVHSWLDEDGHEPRDFAQSAPENRRYIDYYRQMGMTQKEAEAFYAMTNSVPFASARWFDAAEMGRWVRLDDTYIAPSPLLAAALVVDSGSTLQ